ncbi:MAG: hypothetical protein QXO32_06155 [Candidatus Bathyarchaeia archaeon]
MKDALIVVRVPKELKKSLSEHGVEVSRVVRKALEEEVKKRKLEELKGIAGDLGDFFSRMPDEEIVKTIKELRKSR